MGQDGSRVRSQDPGDLPPCLHFQEEDEDCQPEEDGERIGDLSLHAGIVERSDPGMELRGKNARPSGGGRYRQEKQAAGNKDGKDQ